MEIKANQIVPISEANQNFSRVARLTDRVGQVYVFKNNKPMYKIVSLEASCEIEMSDEEKIDFVAARVLKKHINAFKELAK
ncbi:MAG: type II toxin-antitoxin system Phd/YefM family antitoxin [Clostridia bacterium]|nr:type II toxin-antitoxin system Phd/YefM family antitoxin [Clostridia bacterium]